MNFRVLIVFEQAGVTRDHFATRDEAERYFNYLAGARDVAFVCWQERGEHREWVTMNTYMVDIGNPAPKVPAEGGADLSGFPELLTTDDVMSVTGISRTTLWRMANDPASAFPRAVRPSPGRLFYRKDDLLAWFEAQRRHTGCDAKSPPLI